MKQEFQNKAVKNWESMLSEKEDIAELFKELGLDDYQAIQVISRRVWNYGLIIIVDAIDRKQTISRIIIDVTSGIPSWQQFINVTYDEGGDADIKIILYGIDYEEGILAGRLFELGCLVRRNNECGVKTYKAGGIRSDDRGHTPLAICDIDEAPALSSMRSGLELPSKTEILKGEFWVGYYYPQLNDVEPGLYNYILRGWRPGFSLSRGFSARTLWHEDGFYMNLTHGPDSEIIDWIWTDRISSLKMAYPDSTIKLDNQHDDYRAICVKILDIPMQEIFEMEPSNKWEYAELLLDMEIEFCTMAEQLIKEYIDETSGKNPNS